ncbi:MAG TPA: hypothetical protein PLP29_07495 [Candidatus Ozemobacteraceae bacterium]|nr:hypothetical protein [Candidatus Ozemobacteraceae bacterium]
MSRPETGLPGWLGGYLLLLPLGIPLFTYLVPSDLCLAFGLAAGIAAHIQRPSHRLPEPRDTGSFPAAALAFGGFCLLGSLVTGQPGAVAFELVSIAWLALGAWMISRVIPSPDAWNAAVHRFNLLFLPVLLFCVAGLASHWVGWDAWTGGVFSFRLYLPFRFPILLGAYLIAAHPFAVIWPGMGSAKRMMYNILFIIAVSGVGARSCMLVAIGQVVWSELRSDAEMKPVLPGWLRLALALTAFGAIGLLLADELSFQRSFGLSGVPALAQDLPRERQLDRALTHLDDLLIGIGPGCFRAIHGEELHNTPLNLLVETGIGGFLTAHAVLLAALLPVIRGLRARGADERRRAAALLGAVAGLYLLGLFHNLLRNRFVWLVLALALAWPKTPAGDAEERPWI